MTKWISVNETAVCTQHSRQWVHQRIADGTFSAERKGRHVDVDGNTVQDWMVDEMERIVDQWKFFYHNLPNGYYGQPKTD